MLFVAYESDLGLGRRRGYLAALEARSGVAIWTSLVPVERNDRSTMIDAPILVDDLVIGSDMFSNAVVAYDRSSGALSWRWEGPPGWVGPYQAPVERDGIVYVASGDLHVYALDAQTGALVWAKGLDSSVNGVALCGGYLLANRYVLDVLDPATGSIRQELFKSPDEFVIGGMTVSGDRVYFATQKRLVSFDCGG